MGEAAAAAAPCLMRSVSQPLFASREFKEGDPLRALTTSISFGRFLTEPLDWERWSAFSHNRTQEDVKKHSRPGAVAEKKAFFEAYFNKFASKKSSKQPRKENKPPNYSPQTNASPATVSNTPKNQSPTVATDENMCNRGAEPEPTPNQDVSSPSINLVFSEKRNVDDIISSSGQTEQEKTSTGNASSPIVSSNRRVERHTSSNENFCSPLANLVFPEMGNVVDIISSTSQAEHEKPSTNIVFSEKGNADDIISSSGKMEHEQPGTNLVFSEKGNVDDTILSVGRIEQEKESAGNVSSENHCFQVKVSNQSSQVEKNKKRQIKDKESGQTKTEISSVRSSSKKAPIPEIHPKNQILKYNPRDKESGQTKTEISSVRSSSRKAPIPEIHPKNQIFKYNPRDKESGQTITEISSVRSWSKKAPIPEIHPKNQILKYNPRVSSLNGVKKSTQALPRSENKRPKPLLDCSVNGNITVGSKSHSTNHSEALIASTKKPRSITVPSSFTFKSDERAAKRKQFFQKLEEIPRLKEKTRSDDNKLRWSAVVEAELSTSETKGPSNKIQKVQPTRTGSQKLGTKPKNFIEINKKKLSSSMACLPSKKRLD